MARSETPRYHRKCGPQSCDEPAGPAMKSCCLWRLLSRRARPLRWTRWVLHPASIALRRSPSCCSCRPRGAQRS
eukprot:11197770-Lingulodinium_polyedra.AAC.1